MKYPVRKFVVQFRMTNKDQSIDRDDTKVFNDLQSAKVFLCDGLNTCENVWKAGGIAISVGQIVEELWSPDENPELPFPMYRETERIATYVPLKNNGWERIDDTQ